MNKSKQLRDFIKSHEMRYFVEHSDYSGQTRIKKAFKVEINNAEYWVHFFYGDRPEIKDERILLKTMDEAKAKAKKLRDEYQKKKKESADKRKATLEYVTNLLNSFRWYNYIKDYKTNEINPDAQPFADAIKRVYEDMPNIEKDDDKTYIKLLENYIKNGTIYTQAISFRKEHVVCVKYGDSGVVQIELINGTTITPKSNGVKSLIRKIFGGRLDTWSYKDIKEPCDKYDKIKEPKR